MTWAMWASRQILEAAAVGGYFVKRLDITRDARSVYMHLTHPTRHRYLLRVSDHRPSEGEWRGYAGRLCIRRVRTLLHIVRCLSVDAPPATESHGILCGLDAYALPGVPLPSKEEGRVMVLCDSPMTYDMATVNGHIGTMGSQQRPRRTPEERASVRASSDEGDGVASLRTCDVADGNERDWTSNTSRLKVQNE